MNNIFILTLLHLGALLIYFGSFIFAFLLLKKVKEKISLSWTMFTSGLFCISLAELVDMLTPIYKQPLGSINELSETIEVIGLAFLFLGILHFSRKRLKTRFK